MESLPEYMASVLESYRRSEAMTPERLRQWLGVDEARYLRLAMCGRPDGDSDEFGSQVREIASYVEIDPVRLADLVRHVDALAAMTNRTVSTQSETEARFIAVPGLLAARDRLDDADQYVKKKSANPPAARDNIADDNVQRDSELERNAPVASAPTASESAASESDGSPSQDAPLPTAKDSPPDEPQEPPVADNRRE